ncbi:hypothetical protein [Pseudomonas luteola]|uniref:hypothetical protein n=1 Tax=Pseudomonas luteola TaxID=47886 RepID=UPI0028994CE8|nr:hypothetical protein [Pseudomonas luteola]
MRKSSESVHDTASTRAKQIRLADTNFKIAAKEVLSIGGDPINVVRLNDHTKEDKEYWLSLYAPLTSCKGMGEFITVFFGSTMDDLDSSKGLFLGLKKERGQAYELSKDTVEEIKQWLSGFQQPSQEVTAKYPTAEWVFEF